VVNASRSAGVKTSATNHVDARNHLDGVTHDGDVCFLVVAGTSENQFPLVLLVFGENVRYDILPFDVSLLGPVYEVVGVGFVFAVQTFTECK